MDEETKVIAFYLPQYHPIPENDEWWGKGFTEWTNVAKAQPMYYGHQQPKVPADLGFYDLRLSEVRLQQVSLAKEAGVTAFCYWHYWFGGGKRLLQKPLQDLLANNEPNFPFCLAWANHSWQKKYWNSSTSRLNKETLIEQRYPGKQDVVDHFNELLTAFMDKRYLRIDDKLVFVIYNYEEIPNLTEFMNLWQKLAFENGLGGFYFIAHIMNSNHVEKAIQLNFDAVNLHLLPTSFHGTRLLKVLSWLLNTPLDRIKYKKAIYKWEDKKMKHPEVFPTLYPNWDTTPRLGSLGQILTGSSPDLFRLHVSRILNLIKDKPINRKVVFIKSWNEWAEGNYLEPDLKNGRSYLKALRSALECIK